MHILVIQSDPQTPPGIVGERILARGGRMDIRHPHSGDALPDAIAPYDALLLLGGPMNAEDDANYPAIPRIIEVIREFQADDRAVLGICLGVQFLARSAGERVYPRGTVEIGFEPIRTLPAAAADPVLRELTGTHRIMQWHYDTFDMPPAAVPLMIGEDCPHQGFRLGRASYGFQCHFEADRRIVTNWLDNFGAGLIRYLGARGPGEIARVRAELERHGAAARAFAERVSENWLDLVRVTANTR